MLGVFGSRVPTTFKVFLLTLAIFDALAAIIIIALFDAGDLSVTALSIGVAILAIAIVMNKIGVTRTSAYVLARLVL